MRRPMNFLTAFRHVTSNPTPMPIRPDEIETLYREHGAAVLSYLERRCPTECAPDLLQETFLQVVRQADRKEEVITPRAWIFGIARNVLSRYFRDQPPEPSAFEAALTSSEPEDARLPRMREAMARLPAELRETLELRIGQELSYEEIAAVLQIPLGTVRSRLHHAVKRLREALMAPE